jgi:hypothetical protein
VQVTIPQDILDDIAAERAEQDAKYGGPTHDDGHDPIDWCLYIIEHATKPFKPEAKGYRKQLVRVAALAIAAIQAHDRKQE